MGMNEDGFLSEEALLWKQKHLREAADAFRIATELNRAAIKALYAGEPKHDDPHTVTASALFARMLEHYESAITLLQIGAIPSAQCLLRVMCEVSFAIAMVAKEPSFVAEYLDDDRHRRLKMLDALLGLRLDESTISKEEREMLKAEARGLRVELKDKRQKELVVFDTARRAGLLHLYRFFYVTFSNTIHTSARDLDSHVVRPEDGLGYVGMRWGPDSRQVEDMVDAAIEIFSTAFHFFMQVFPHAEARMKLDSLWVEQRARLDRKAKQLDRMPKAWDPAYKRYAIHPT
jgi:hypothetical protein